MAACRAQTREGARKRRAWEKAIELKNYEFNAHGVEMNQRYVSGAVLPDGGSAVEEFARDAELYAQPTTRPGAKLPHAWLVAEDGTRVSTLDVIGGRGSARGKAKLGSKFHDSCRCLVVMVRPGQTYEPPEYVRQWHKDYAAAPDPGRTRSTWPGAARTSTASGAGTASR